MQAVRSPLISSHTALLSSHLQRAQQARSGVVAVAGGIFFAKGDTPEVPLTASSTRSPKTPAVVARQSTMDREWTETLDAQDSGRVLECKVVSWNDRGVCVHLMQHQAITGQTLAFECRLG